jgi:ribosomal protein S18 acetylase RimI-like enzyme
MNDQIEVVLWDKKFEKQAHKLLNKYKETSLLLLSNLKTYGTKLTADTYSGDFKCLIKDYKIVGVFALTKVGNLLVQTDRAGEYSKIIIDECLRSDIRLKGVVGDWKFAKPLWDYAKQKLPRLRETLFGKEILYQLVLSNLLDIRYPHEVRYLKSTDYQEWDRLNKAYMKEQKVNENEDEKARYKRFIQDTEIESWYGLFINGRMISIACHTANVDGFIQIGGVYTLPEMRRKGFAKELMYKLLLDGKINKHMKVAILFTGVDNVAKRLYESLGFKQIGYFGLLFGEYDK